MKKTKSTLVMGSLLRLASIGKTMSYLKFTEDLNDIFIANGLEPIVTTDPSYGRVLGELLDDVNDTCVILARPPISCLIVRASGRDKGLPGKGFWNWCHANGLTIAEPSIAMRRELHADYIKEAFIVGREIADLAGRM